MNNPTFLGVKNDNKIETINVFLIIIICLSMDNIKSFDNKIYIDNDILESLYYIKLLKINN